MARTWKSDAQLNTADCVLIAEILGAVRSAGGFQGRIYQETINLLTQGERVFSDEALWRSLPGFILGSRKVTIRKQLGRALDNCTASR